MRAEHKEALWFSAGHWPASKLSRSGQHILALSLPVFVFERGSKRKIEEEMYSERLACYEFYLWPYRAVSKLI